MFRTMQGLCWTFSWYTHFPCSFTKHTLSYLFVSNDPSHYFLSSSLMEGAHKLYINDGNNNACCTEWLYEHWTLWNKVKKIILPFSFIEEVHANNIIHADIKPANFVLVKGQLKIIDFGFAMKIGKKCSFKKSSNSFH